MVTMVKTWGIALYSLRNDYNKSSGFLFSAIAAQVILTKLDIFSHIPFDCGYSSVDISIFAPIFNVPFPFPTVVRWSAVIYHCLRIAEPTPDFFQSWLQLFELCIRYNKYLWIS